MWWKLALIPLVPVLFMATYFAFLSWNSPRPKTLGLQAGRLANCPAKPNCVCSQAPDDKDHYLAALPFTDAPDAAWLRLQKVIEAQPTAKMVTRDATYLHAEFTSLLFRFVDDVECLLDPEQKLIHFRSASRAGYSDLGVNKARMEKIRAEFAASGAN